MKLQLAPGSLRLRLDRAEFDRLLAGESLALCVPMPGGRWQVHAMSAEAFALRPDGPRLALELPAGELAGLATRLPSREGLAWQAGHVDEPLEVVLEVDIRGSGRPRAPAR